MTSLYASLDTRLRSLPDLALLAIGLATIAGIAAFRVTAPHGVPVVDFLLIPVAGVGWLTRRRGYGYALAVVAGVVSFAMAVAAPTTASFGAATTAGVTRLVLYLIVLSLLSEMRRTQVKHETEARTDPLTAAANARAFRTLATAEIERSRRYQHELSLAYLDVDDLKAVNDRLGHLEGDHILLQMSHVMRCVVRAVDTVARLGGDEFAVLMPETRPAEARVLIDRIARELASLTTQDGRPVACSIGLVTFLRPPVSLQELLDAADHLMYRAKQNGKDRIEQAERSGSIALTSGG